MPSWLPESSLFAFPSLQLFGQFLALAIPAVTLFRFDRTNLNVTASLSPALPDPGRVHFNLEHFLWRKFNFNISLYGNWDTQPPAGFSGSDYGTSVGVIGILATANIVATLS
jgi:hypothetical protein